jgi:hypothetical protein
MQTENITKARDSFQFFIEELRAAHKDAIFGGNQFALMALFDLLQEAVKLEQKVQRIAAIAAEEAEKSEALTGESEALTGESEALTGESEEGLSM